MTGLRASILTVLVLMILVIAEAAGCAGAASRRQITVVGPWTGHEEERFKEAVKIFEDREKITVNYQGTRALDQLLAGELQKGTPPDIAVLPSPGDLKPYESVLTPLEDVVEAEWPEYAEQWQELSRSDPGHLYAIPILVNLKSMVWYNTNGPPFPEPRTLGQLTALRSPSGSVFTWCIGMGSAATSGWPGTDWIEDILLQQQGTDVYQQWVAGALKWTSPQVRQAWTTWGRIMIGAGQSRDNSAAALLTDFSDAGRPMFARPQGCSVEHQGSFIAGFYENYRTTNKLQSGADFSFFDFPPSADSAVPGRGRSRLVSADLAVMFNGDDKVRKLMRFLASNEAQEIWPQASPVGFSANTMVPPESYDNEVDRRIRNALVGGDTLCFDASDMMPATMRNAFYRAALEYLSRPADVQELDDLLGDLDTIRSGLPAESWLTVSCGRAR